MTFNRRCDNEQPHPEHEYEQHWHKADLIYLPSIIARNLPDEWDVTYTCKGIDVPCCTSCGTPLQVDTLMIARRAMFCPFVNCPQFAQSFWVER